MRSLDAAELSAIAANTVIVYDLLTIIAFDRDTNAEVEYGYWNGDGPETFDVVDGITGATETRSFVGSGAIQEIGPVTLTTDLSVRPVEITMSILHATVEAMVRGHTVRNGRIQLYRVYISADSRLPVAAAKPRLVGVIDEASITTAEIGGESIVRLSCVSRLRELTRTNVGVRSHEDQKQRSATDTFFQDVVTVGEWEIFWGQNASKTNTEKGGFFARMRARGAAARASWQSR